MCQQAEQRAQASHPHGWEQSGHKGKINKFCHKIYFCEDFLFIANKRGIDSKMSTAQQSKAKQSKEEQRKAKKSKEKQRKAKKSKEKKSKEKKRKEKKRKEKKRKKKITIGVKHLLVLKSDLLGDTGLLEPSGSGALRG